MSILLANLLFIKLLLMVGLYMELDYLSLLMFRKYDACMLARLCCSCLVFLSEMITPLAIGHPISYGFICPESSSMAAVISYICYI